MCAWSDVSVWSIMLCACSIFTFCSLNFDTLCATLFWALIIFVTVPWTLWARHATNNHTVRADDRGLLPYNYNYNLSFCSEKCPPSGKHCCAEILRLKSSIKELLKVILKKAYWLLSVHCVCVWGGQLARKVNIRSKKTHGSGQGAPSSASCFLQLLTSHFLEAPSWRSSPTVAHLQLIFRSTLPLNLKVVCNYHDY